MRACRRRKLFGRNHNKLNKKIERKNKMQPIDRQAIVNYFKPFPKWAIGMIVLGVLFLSAKGFGLIFIAIGIVGIVMRTKNKPTDEQIDSWFGQELQTLTERAKQKVGHGALDVTGGEKIIYGPRIENTGGAQITFIKGKDNIIRFTPVDITILFFAKDQLLGYQCSYDRRSGEPLAERTEEYFYRDVVAVSTETIKMETELQIGKGKLGKLNLIQFKTAEVFRLTTSGGTAFQVCLGSEDILKLKSAKGGKLPKTESEKAIQAVRAMVRDKKSTSAQTAALSQTASNPSAGGDQASKIQKLKKLLDDGLITQEEFQAEKTKALANL